MNERLAPPIISAVDVDKSFQSTKRPLVVLSKAGLAVREGEMLGIVGASGVGKSTLLHILGGLDRPSSGDVLFKGQSIYRQKNGFLETFRNRNIGFVFQFFNLLNEFTVMENAMFPALIGDRNVRETRERAERLLVEVGLKDRLDHKPGELSGGESQRVALVRALVNQPEVVLADEPTGNLDSHSADSLLDIIRRLNSETGQTFVIVTHSPRIARSLDRVLQLAEGKVTGIDRELIV